MIPLQMELYESAQHGITWTARPQHNARIPSAPPTSWSWEPLAFIKNCWSVLLWDAAQRSRTHLQADYNQKLYSLLNLFSIMHKYQKRFSCELSSLFVAFSVYSSTALNHRINSIIFRSILALVQKHILHLITVLEESIYIDRLFLYESTGISGFRAQKRLKKWGHFCQPLLPLPCISSHWKGLKVKNSFHFI